MRLNLNLATQPYEDVRRFYMQWGTIVALVGILTLGLVTTAGLAWNRSRNTRASISNARAEIQQLETERKHAEDVLARSENAATVAHSQLFNALIVRKAFSWTQIFSDLEKLVPPRVQVKAIIPEINSQNELEVRLQITGETRERAVEFVKKLEQSDHFRLPQVRNESVRPDNNTAVDMEISAIYQPKAKRVTQ